MPQSSVSAFLYIDFDAERGILQFRSLIDAPFSRMKVRLPRSERDLEKGCERYWHFVDDSVHRGALTGEVSDRLSAFYDQLITEGNKLCRILFDADTCRKVWNLAKQSTVLVIITDLLYVPWEALYDSETLSFLSDVCAVIRWPDTSLDKDRGPLNSKFGSERIVCLDPIIAADKRTLIDNVNILDSLEKHFGSDLHITRLKGELAGKAKSTRIVQWICEHDLEGLRVNETVFYNIDDCDAHPFEDGSLLILTSCKTGNHLKGGQSVAVGICCASRCTVIAPLSVVAISVGVKFAMSLDLAIARSQAGTTIRDVWRSLHVSHRQIKESPNLLTAEACFVLWYGLYGSGETVVKSEAGSKIGASRANHRK